MIARGLGASPGAAVGKVVFSADEAAQWAERGEAVVLVRIETSPEDIVGMRVSRGILTARGGSTSHAAVVARGMGKCCVAGCGALEIDYRQRRFAVSIEGRGRVVVNEGDVISIDGTTGEVMLGEVPLVDPVLPDEYEQLMAWADGARQLKVRANADTPEDAVIAREFGAEGIGLCRTEHMFFGEDRILAVREMILAEDETGRRTALAKILPMQREDFTGILRAMEGLPVTIRLLDPPLHEFLPQRPDEIALVAASLDVSPSDIERRVQALHEFNPMLGHRGVRLAITFPEIYEVQAQAILEAACALKAEGVDVMPEIMIPLVGMEDELRQLRTLVVATAERVIAELRRPGRLHRRDDDRAAAGMHRRGQDREVRRLLLLRDERPDADDVRALTRRREPLPAVLPRAGVARARPVPGARPRRRRRPYPHRYRAGTQHAPRPEGRHLW